MRRRRKKARTVQPNDLYTFRVLVSFEMQHTFTGNQVHSDAEGGENDLEPTDVAMLKLEEELEEYIRRLYGINKFEAYTDSEWLIGIEKSGTEPQPKKRVSNRSKRKR